MENTIIELQDELLKTTRANGALKAIDSFLRKWDEKKYETDTRVLEIIGEILKEV